MTFHCSKDKGAKTSILPTDKRAKRDFLSEWQLNHQTIFNSEQKKKKIKNQYQFFIKAHKRSTAVSRLPKS